MVRQESVPLRGISRRETKLNMFYAYVLLSLKSKRIYVGSTEDVENRLLKHNSGKVKSTQFYVPWVIKQVEEYETRAEAVRREMFLKSGQQKELLRKLYC